MTTPAFPNDRIADQIYDIRAPAEQTFWISLLPNERTIFQWFAIGFKRNSWDKDQRIPSQDAVLKAWRDADEIDRETNIVLAKERPDLRLNTSHFEVKSEILLAFEALLPRNEQPDFESLVHGFQIYNVRGGQHNSQDMIRCWNQKNKAMREKMIAYGRHHYNRFQNHPQVPDVRPTASGHHGHWFENPKPDATMGDIKQVNVADPKPPGEKNRPAGSRWVFEKTIYQNPHETYDNKLTHRIIHLFALVTEDRQILKRLVVKIIGSTDVLGVVGTIMRESTHHEALSFKNCASILDAYGFSIRKRAYGPQLGYIYMDYAPFGDLLDLIKRLQGQPDKQLPEPYIWLIFRALAEALLLMETGMTVDKDQPAREDGHVLYSRNRKPIVNPDIKPMNVMLGEAQAGFYPGFKTAKMIDFGMCFDDNRYATGKVGVGTQGNTAPEHGFPPHPKYRNEPVNIQSEIFMVGLVILSLMEGRNRKITDVELFNEGFQHCEGYNKCYSHWLDDLVFFCLQFAPWKRPSLHQLLYKTRRGLERWERVYGSVDKPEAELPEFAIYPLEHLEEFRIGETAPEHWLGMKKRKAEEARLAPARPAVKKRAKNPPPPRPGQIRMGNDRIGQPDKPPFRPPGKGPGPKNPPARPPIGHPAAGRGQMHRPPPLPMYPRIPAQGNHAAPTNRVPKIVPGPLNYITGQPNVPPGQPAHVSGSARYAHPPPIQPLGRRRPPNDRPPPPRTLAEQRNANMRLMQNQARQSAIPRPVNHPQPRVAPRPALQPGMDPAQIYAAAVRARKNVAPPWFMQDPENIKREKDVEPDGDSEEDDASTSEENGSPGGRRSNPIDLSNA
ncbi:kinase-like protein [Cucurbitaria berberidis CBS 394.84]|uniref:Kinase-like protein n=1 Tax=Cucurbitaria berberidis CBS 394.84 TaxID=1168544 RepID=A0A9P4GM71_9PLEO|nr:kinase-like protein [Cucurbitaria berberidis CBS 394.84]KAF1847600.1 kinase-like protein [Cucurbitaria berberidis CBS 394.84]